MLFRCFAFAAPLLAAVPSFAQSPSTSPPAGPDMEMVGPAVEMVDTETAVTWNAAQVRDWAVANAALAGAMEAERRSIGAGFDRDDQAQCKQAGLQQMVLAQLAERDRTRAAADALRTYFQIVAIEQQTETLRDSDGVLRTLLALAKKAEELELPDGDINKLEQQRLELRSKQVDARYGLKKLRIKLANLTGQPASVAATAILIDPIPPQPPEVTREVAIASALANRRDLRAIECVCPRISEDTLPAARSLLGLLQPGAGLAVAVAFKSTLFCQGDEAGQDLCARREQCRKLAQTRREQIRTEVHVAYLERRAAIERLNLARERLEFAQTAADEAAKAVELEQQPAGTDLLAVLNLMETEADVLTRLRELADAEIDLLEARGLRRFEP